MSTRKPIQPVVRFQVFARDGFRCIYCGAGRDDAKLVVDHVIPVKDGGTNDIGNLATACRECNAGKAARSVIDAAEGETVGPVRAKLAGKWLPHLETRFSGIVVARDQIHSQHFACDPDEGECPSPIAFLPNYHARAPSCGRWSGEPVTISLFRLADVGGYSQREQLEIMGAVVSGYQMSSIIILGEPDAFHAFCVNNRRKGNPHGYVLDADLNPSAEWLSSGWYPDENLDFVDLREGDLYPLPGDTRHGRRNDGI